MTLKSIEDADPTNPGVQPRPTVGIQFVDIPEFQDLGTKVTPGRRRGDRRTRHASSKRSTNGSEARRASVAKQK